MIWVLKWFLVRRRDKWYLSGSLVTPDNLNWRFILVELNLWIGKFLHGIFDCIVRKRSVHKSSNIRSRVEYVRFKMMTLNIKALRFTTFLTFTACEENTFLPHHFLVSRWSGEIFIAKHKDMKEWIWKDYGSDEL